LLNDRYTSTSTLTAESHHVLTIEQDLVTAESSPVLGTIDFRIKREAARLWEAAQPHIQTVSATVSSVFDVLNQPVSWRRRGPIQEDQLQLVEFNEPMTVSAPPRRRPLKKRRTQPRSTAKGFSYSRRYRLRRSNFSKRRRFRY